MKSGQMAQNDDQIEIWRAKVAEYLKRAESENDIKLKLAYLDLAEGYRRLISSENTFRAIADLDSDRAADTSADD
jgi:hypothetical protein